MTWAKPDIHYKMTCQKISSSPVASLQNASRSKRKNFQALSLQNDIHDPILTRLISTKITTYRGHVASHFVVVIGGGDSGTASSQNLKAIDLNESQSLKNKCNPAMQTKKLENLL